MKPKTSSFEKMLDYSSSSIMYNPKVFDINFTPQEIIERKETKVLFEHLIGFIKYKVGSHILLSGNPGTGKTVTAQLIRRILSDRQDIMVSYVNCNDKTPSDILTSLLKESKMMTYAHTDLLEKYFSIIDKKSVILVLDEIDKSWRVNKLLYEFSRISELDLAFEGKISLLLISNHPAWESTLEPYIRSSLQLRQINFYQYTEKQLSNILSRRVELGFQKNVISESQINLISKIITTKKNGDCRIAMKALFRAGMLAEQANQDKITDEIITKAIQEASHEIETRRVTKLTINQFLVLLTAFDGTTSLNSFVKEYEQNVKAICGDKLSPLKTTAVYQTIAYLKDLGLLDRNIKTKKEKGKPPIKSTFIEPTISKKIVLDELTKRVPSIDHMKPRNNKNK